MSTPLVSVIMPIYNVELYLQDAIESILNQTYANFELLIINDGSTDCSEQIVNSFDDSRIQFYNYSVNRGLITTLNEGLSLAKGKYIARMDGDDICIASRIESQVLFMERNINIGVCGTWGEVFNDSGAVFRLKNPSDSVEIEMNFIWLKSGMIHPSILARRFLFDNLQYSQDYHHCEDFKLWTDLRHKTKFANIPKVLLRYRAHSAQVSNQYKEIQVMNGLKTIMPLLAEFGLDQSAVANYLKYMEKTLLNNNEVSLEEIMNNAFMLIQKNNAIDLYPMYSFNRCVAKNSYNIFRKSNKFSYALWLKSPLFKYYKGLSFL